MTPKVVHFKREKYDVFIGRPGPWGNPFIVGKDGGRDECIEMYILWFMAQPELIQKAKVELKGKILGCWCAPKPCHGDFLCRIANE